MSKRQKTIWIVAVVILVGLVLVWFERLYQSRVGSPDDAEKIGPGALEQTTPAPTVEAGGSGGSDADAGRALHRPIPSPPAGRESAPNPLPPSPPLPQVAPEATEEQRKDLFRLDQSVDHIVTADEPFEIAGEQVTIKDIKQRLGLSPASPSPSEETTGSEQPAGYLKKPIPKHDQPVYYGVREVHRGENVWKIHFQILRDYFLRRQVELLPTADRPDPSGRSSGIGRLLKFLEGVVYVYDVKAKRAVPDVNWVDPDTVIIFFRISEVFTALDQLQANDLAAVRLLRQQVILERGAESEGLLYRDDFR